MLSIPRKTRWLGKDLLLVCLRRRTTGHPECSEKPRNPYYDPQHHQSINGRTPRCFVGKKHMVTMAKGVGIGPEQMEIVKRVFQVVNAPVEFEVLELSGEDESDTDMENLIYSVERNGVCISGNIEKAFAPVGISRNMKLRRALDLYVYLVEIKSYPEIAKQTRHQSNVDVVMVRQNTEGEHAMLEHNTGRAVEHLKITTKYNTERLAVFAFDYAIKKHRRKVTCVYDKNVMTLAEELFVNTVTEVSARYPEMPLECVSINTFAARMDKFEFNGDVLITSVMYGGIILNLLNGLMHGAGLFSGSNLGSRYAVFQPAARHKGFKMVGKDITNPVAPLMCGVKLLRYLQHDKVADKIERAIELTINDDRVITQDVFGTASTSETVRNIERRIREVMPEGYDLKDAPLVPASML